jgi:hypothetical protein
MVVWMDGSVCWLCGWMVVCVGCVDRMVGKPTGRWTYVQRPFPSCVYHTPPYYNLMGMRGPIEIIDYTGSASGGGEVPRRTSCVCSWLPPVYE